MKKSIITGLVIISVALTSLAAFGPHHDGKGFRGDMKMTKVFSKLDLSDEQKESFKALRASQKSQRESLRSQMRANMDIDPIFTEQGFNKAKFIENATERFSKRIQTRADFMEKAYAILDENQRAELIKQMQEMRLQRAK
jgi:Spy/CpxP family protein refolding chaperone